MEVRQRSAKDDLIGAVMQIAEQRVPEDRRAEAQLFIHQYYRRLPHEDLEGRSPEDLYFAALSMLNFIRTREAHHDKLRVYNPDIDADGWSSTHSVIDLVTGDRPFLVDSLTATLNQSDIAIYLVVHPNIRVRRSDKGVLEELYPPSLAAKEMRSEAVIRLEVSRHSDAESLAALEAKLQQVLSDVRIATSDWQHMQNQLEGALGELRETAKSANAADLDETVAFLDWLLDNHFTFLGYRSYDLAHADGGIAWQPREGESLGLLRDTAHWEHTEDSAPDRGVPQEVLAYLRSGGLLMITKTRRVSTVHRPVPMDSIGIKRFGPDGSVIGAHRFVGLFTSAAYNQSPTKIPLLRQKVAIAVARAGFQAASHDGKILTNILETYPRDELFQISDDELLEASLGVLHLQERPRIRLFVRRDSFERFVSCLVFVPRDRYDSSLRRVFSQILEDAFNGICDSFYAKLSDHPLAQLHIIVHTVAGQIPNFQVSDIEARIIAAARGWEDQFREALLVAHDEHLAAVLERRYGDAFPAGYRERFGVRHAVFDTERVEAAIAADKPELNLYRPPESPDNEARFKIYQPNIALPLSDVLPVLENMGLKVINEFPYRLAPSDGTAEVWIHDFGVKDRSDTTIDIAAVKAAFQDAFGQVWHGRVENDGFNRLIVRAGLSWRQIVILRAYCKYLRQAKIPFSQDYMEQTLTSQPRVARLLVEFFDCRFNPKTGSEERAGAIETEIIAALDDISNLDDDRIIRRYLNIIKATLRTNYYQSDADGTPKPYLSFKIDSAAVTDLPLPRPMAEIWVYAVGTEGVHLRGGPVARGGLRWSDRPEDFRTEVLGLMKAQMVKNSVIVPVGAKGGFVVKRPPVGADRETLMAEVVSCYRTFISGLLDITDNLVEGQVVPPQDLLRYDGDDPYLVVAADKGTATFSDIANETALAYGFWLGDAFASGGSAGYDHKKMGITARGAWESVKRHFREFGHDTQNAPFTVIGVGDMSGDVFGNGMLLSPHIKLQAAFNHLHIFVDPDPEPAGSFAERKRLFELTRSSWSDYDTALISTGGGVFDRKAKAISLSAEMQKLVGATKESMTPNEFISALLRAPVDLLWNGGIGTYVKAHDESDAQVGDRANDALRVDARDLRCRVIGEGGNLGLTQRARIEAASRGVKVNTDAIDNSAGVDCSDHEVNIKILLGEIVTAGDMTMKQRDQLLVDMTDDVAASCLRDNYLQSQGISVIESQGAERLAYQARLMQSMERAGLLDRAIEFLPDSEEIEERRVAKRGLTRPEISVLFAYVKNALYDELLASDLPDDAYLEGDLIDYFPKALRKKYARRIKSHRLRREIIATHVANSLINRSSMVFPLMAAEQTGQAAANVARAYVVTREAFDLRRFWADIDGLDNHVPADVQTRMIFAFRRLMEHACLWFLREQPQPMDSAAVIARFKPGISELLGMLDDVLPLTAQRDVESRATALGAEGVPDSLARVVSAVNALYGAVDIVEVANAANQDVRQTAMTYYGLGDRLGYDWLRAGARDLKTESHWQRQAANALIDDIYAQQRALTAQVIADGGTGDGAIEAWFDAKHESVEATEHLMSEMRSARSVELAMLTVASGRMRALLSR